MPVYMSPARPAIVPPRMLVVQPRMLAAPQQMLPARGHSPAVRPQHPASGSGDSQESVPGPDSGEGELPEGGGDGPESAEPDNTAQR